MPQDVCMLTTKDLTILEVMLDRCLDREGTTGVLLARKIRAAMVVFSDDIPPDVATIGSRIGYRVDDGEPDSRILSHDRMTFPVGLYLPITAPTGLALLGMTVGQSFRLDTPDGARHILLETVSYQPEAAKRERAAQARLATPDMRRKAFRLVSGTLHDGGLEKLRQPLQGPDQSA